MRKTLRVVVSRVAPCARTYPPQRTYNLLHGALASPLSARCDAAGGGGGAERRVGYSCRMLNLLIEGAVPFGYTAEGNDGDFLYADDSISISAMNWTNLQSPSRQTPLPDVILSNTPPPSPLRRAHSYLTLLPEKAQEHLSSALPLQDRESPFTSLQGDEGASSTGEGKERVRTGLEHIEEVRRRLQCDQEQPHQDLPSLSWSIPDPQRKREGKNNGEEERGERGSRERERGERKSSEARLILQGEKKDQEEGRWRSIGRDLRRIADQFQLKNSKSGRKSEVPSPLTPTRSIQTFIISLLSFVSTLHQAPLIPEDVTSMSFFASLASLWSLLRIFGNMASS